MRPHKDYTENRKKKEESTTSKNKTQRPRRRQLVPHPYEGPPHFVRTFRSFPRLLETTSASSSSDDSNIINRRDLESFMISRLRRAQISMGKSREPKQHSETDDGNVGVGSRNTKAPLVHAAAAKNKENHNDQNIRTRAVPIVRQRDLRKFSSYQNKNLSEQSTSRSTKLINLEKDITRIEPNRPSVNSPEVSTSKTPDNPENRKKISPFMRQSTAAHWQQIQYLIDREEEQPMQGQGAFDNNYLEVTKRIRTLENIVERQNTENQTKLPSLGEQSSAASLSKDFHDNQEGVSDNWGQGRSDSVLIHNREIQGRMTFENKQFLVLYILITLLGLLMIILTFSWTKENLRYTEVSATLKDWHPLLSVIAFLFLNSQSMLVFRFANQVIKDRLRDYPHVFVKTHLALVIIAFIVGLISLIGVFNDDVVHFYTLHSWLGLGAFILFSITLFFGFPLIRSNMPFQSLYYYSLPFHVSIGNSGFIVLVLTSIAGYMEMVTVTLGEKYYTLPGQGILINIIGILMMIFSGLVIFLLQERNE